MGGRVFTKWVSAALVLGLAGSAPGLFGQNVGPTPAAPQRTDAPGDFFPPSMQSFPLYGHGAIPNSKPGPDEESVGGFIRKVSRPQIQVYLPAKVKGNGASVVVFPGGSYAGLTFDYEGTQQAQFFVDHGIAAFV